MGTARAVAATSTLAIRNDRSTSIPAVSGAGPSALAAGAGQWVPLAGARHDGRIIPRRGRLSHMLRVFSSLGKTTSPFGEAAAIPMGQAEDPPRS